MSEIVSKNIRAHRIACGMTQDELAARIFTTRQTISNYETGRSKPDYETIGKIAEALGVSGEALLYDIGGRRKKLRLWLVMGIAVFVFLLMSSLRHSALIVSRSTGAYLTYGQGYITIVIPAVCWALGWGLVRFYELYVHKNELHIGRSRALLAALAIVMAGWLLWAFIEMAQVYGAVADVVKNEHGGPMMLGLYIESFYYKYIYTLLWQLPVLNSIFVLAGGAFAVSLNGEGS